MRYLLLILVGICLAGSGLCRAEDTAGQTKLTTFTEQNFGVRFSHSTNLSTSYNPHGGADRVMLAYNGKPIGGLLVRAAPPAESIKEFIEAGKQHYKEKWGASTVDYKVYENHQKYRFHHLKAEVKQNGEDCVLERFVHLRDDSKTPADAAEKVIRSVSGAFSFEFAYLKKDREMVTREIKTVIDTFKIDTISVPKPDK
jgi:hypothetical protein